MSFQPYQHGQFARRGVLYFHIHDPMIQSNLPLGLDEIEQEIFKKFKMKGLLLGDQEVVRLMDTTLQEGRSNIINAGLLLGFPPR